jgi:hypothetical protein
VIYAVRIVECLRHSCATQALRSNRLDMQPTYLDYLSAVADLFSIGAAGIAIFLFLFKQKEISAAFHVLLNFSYQTTLTELTQKLERLNEYRASNPEDFNALAPTGWAA